MTVEKMYESIRYTLTNEDLIVGDKVFPIARGRVKEDNSFILHELDYRGFMSDFPEEPHTLLDLKHSDYKPYEVRTSHGYSPRECYYKVVKKERKVVDYKESNGLKLKTRDEWVEI